MERSGRYTVVKEQNDHGTVTLRKHPRNETYHVVECDDEDVEAALGEARPGDVVHLELRRAGRRGNAWCATDARHVTGGR